MFFRYGSYQHPQNEIELAQFNITPKRSANGIRVSTMFTMHLQGELYVDDGIITKDQAQANLTNKINLLIDAYKDDYKDCGFYQDNGLPTPHVLPNNHPDNLSGNIIIHRNWPMGDGNEYATKRTFTIGIQAEFKNAYSQVVSYEDSIVQQGDGGAEVQWYTRRFGAPQFQVAANQTLVIYKHSGGMTALDAYPIPPMPLYSRPYYLGHLTKIARKGPQRFARGYRYYTVEWNYIYVLPAPALILPTRG